MTQPSSSSTTPTVRRRLQLPLPPGAAARNKASSSSSSDRPPMGPASTPLRSSAAGTSTSSSNRSTVSLRSSPASVRRKPLSLPMPPNSPSPRSSSSQKSIFKAPLPPLGNGNSTAGTSRSAVESALPMTPNLQRTSEAVVSNDVTAFNDTKFQPSTPAFPRETVDPMDETTQLNAPSNEALMPLPDGWTEHYSSQDGRPYYCHVEQQLTQWDRPEMSQAVTAQPEAVNGGTMISETTDEVDPVAQHKEPQGHFNASVESSTPASTDDPASAFAAAGPSYAMSENSIAEDVAETVAPSLESAAEQSRHNVAAAQPHHDDTVPPPDAADTLPDGWTVSYIDDGTPYYVNDEMGITQWDKPIATTTTTEIADDDNENDANGHANDFDTNIGMATAEDATNTSSNQPSDAVDLQNNYRSVDTTPVTSHKTASVTTDAREPTKESIVNDTLRSTEAPATDSLADNAQAKTPTLPTGWIEHLTDDGTPFYEWIETGHRQWDRPAPGGDNAESNEEVAAAAEDTVADTATAAVEETNDSAHVWSSATDEAIVHENSYQSRNHDALDHGDYNGTSSSAGIAAITTGADYPKSAAWPSSSAYPKSAAWPSHERQREEDDIVAATTATGSAMDESAAPPSMMQEHVAEMTATTQFSLPSDANGPNSSDNLPEANGNSATASDGADVADPLPNGWYEAWTNNGELYYEHPATQTTQWHRPTFQDENGNGGNDMFGSPTMSTDEVPTSETEPLVEMRPTHMDETEQVVDVPLSSDENYVEPKQTVETAIDDKLLVDTTPLPEGWSESRTKDGIPFYQSASTGAMQWDRPMPLEEHDAYQEDDSRDPDHVPPHTDIAYVSAAPDDVGEEPFVDTQDENIAPANDLNSPSVYAEETEAMPTASAATFIEPLPEGWIEQLTDEGYPYYQMTSTGHRQWDRPTSAADDADVRETGASVVRVGGYDDALQSELDALEDTNIAQSMDVMDAFEPTVEVPNVLQEDVALDVSELPEGWIEHRTGDGAPYYEMIATGESQWDRPTKEFGGLTYAAASAENPPSIQESGDDMAVPPAEDSRTSVAGVDGLETPLSPGARPTTVDGSDFMAHSSAGEAFEHHDESVFRLPDGWMESSADNGTPYYLHEPSGNWQWERPESATFADEPAPADETVGASTVHPPERNLQEEVAPYSASEDVPTKEHDMPLTGESVTGTLGVTIENHVDDGTPSCNIERDGTEPDVVDPQLYSDEVPEFEEGQALVSRALPPGWSEHHDGDGRPYYVSEDGTTSWDRPDLDASVARAPANNHSDEVDGIDRQVAEAAEPNYVYALPDDWEEKVDEGSGLPYYVYRPDGTTTWDRPRLPVNPSESFDQKAFEEPNEPPLNPNDDVLLEGIPAGWVKLIDESSGKSFYFRQADNATTWDLPPMDDRTRPVETGNDATVEALDPPSRDVPSSDRLYDDDEEEGDEEDDDDLGASYNYVAVIPTGWVEKFDESTGKPFYLKDDGSVSWVLPQADLKETARMASVEVSGANLPGQESRGTSDPIQMVASEQTWDRPLEIEESLVVAPNDNVAQFDSPNDFAEETGKEDTNALAEGWKLSVDETTGESYYYNELTGATSWEPPLTQVNRPTNSALDPGALIGSALAQPVPDASRGYSNGMQSEHSAPWDYGEPLRQQHNESTTANENGRHCVGRPRNACASIGFGGRLCTMRSYDGSGNFVLVQRMFDVVPRAALVQMEFQKQSHGIQGPFNATEERIVSQYVEGMFSSAKDLLWGLVAASSKSHGRLRSASGISEPTIPEALVVKLLLSDFNATPIEYSNGDSPKLGRENTQAMSNLGNIESLLLTGHRQEAVEEAILCGNFTLALLIATLCSREVHQHAANCFADEMLPNGHPLRTLILLCAGKLYLPPGENGSRPWDSVSDALLQDTWRRHLTMLLSNPTEGWEDHVLSLGDRLLKAGSVSSAHFCFMVCGCSIKSPVSSNSRMTLLGCDFSAWDFVLASDASIEAFVRTEALEWSKRLGNSNATIPSLQPFKLMYATLLAEYGFENAAKQYIDSVTKCLDATDEELNATAHIHAPLSTTMVTPTRLRLLAALSSLDSRLCQRFPLQLDPVPSKHDPREDSELNTSFITARTNINDASQFAEHPVNDRDLPGPISHKPMPHVSPADAAMPPQMTEAIGQQFDENPQRNAPPPDETPYVERDIPDQSQFHNRHEVRRPPGALDTAFESDESAGLDALRTPPHSQDQNGSANSEQRPSRPQAAPVSAPANLGSSTKAPSSKGRGMFDFGIKKTFTRLFNPDATVVGDLGDKMEAYYDEDKKRWIFPGEDPAEVAKDVGPPPTAPQASPAPTPETTAPLDPLAALMAPMPRRAPSRSASSTPGPRPSPSSMPVMFPPGMMPATTPAGAPPSFAVFTPRAENREASKENESPAVES